MSENLLSGSDLRRFESIRLKNCLTIIDEINHYQPKSVGDTPRELVAFRGLNSTTEGQRTEFYRQGFIREFLEKKWIIELYNRDCFMKLWDLLQVCEELDKIPLINKLHQFRNMIKQQKKPYRALKIDFNKFSFPPPSIPVDSRVQAALEAVGGQITEWEE